ncbi:hypothetical protein C8Q80DRAFT_629577 [Daedaleopsis nitida]|nr:hypothetical protein C8Q80DRAFT_629577 [Daedaleopsis nitida]
MTIWLAVQSKRSTHRITAYYALDDASCAQLQLAIETGPEGRVKDAFAALVNSTPGLPERIFQMLVTVQTPRRPSDDDSEDDDDEDDEDSDEDESSTTKPKVLVPRWQMCRNCNEEFDAGVSERECPTHPGELEMGSDPFQDRRGLPVGPVNSERNQRAHPEMYTWSCCNEDGTDPGCNVRYHEPEPQQRRRKRARHH